MSAIDREKLLAWATASIEMREEKGMTEHCPRCGREMTEVPSTHPTKKIANYERDEYESDLVVYAKCKRIAIEALSSTEPTGAERVREPVAWFAQRMEAKLRENDHKGGWENCSLDWLIERLFQEANELWRTINHPSTFEMVIYEAADVANFAMMIADIARRINAPETEKEGRTE